MYVITTIEFYKINVYTPECNFSVAFFLDTTCQHINLKSDEIKFLGKYE